MVARRLLQHEPRLRSQHSLLRARLKDIKVQTQQYVFVYELFSAPYRANWEMQHDRKARNNPLGGNHTFDPINPSG